MEIFTLIHVIIGGSRGGVRDAHPPPGRPNSFDFMQFLGKFGVFMPPLEGSRPPRENPGSATGNIEKMSHFKALLHFRYALYNTGDCVCLIESFHLSTRSPILDNFKF